MTSSWEMSEENAIVPGSDLRKICDLRAVNTAQGECSELQVAWEMIPEKLGDVNIGMAESSLPSIGGVNVLRRSAVPTNATLLSYRFSAFSRKKENRKKRQDVPAKKPATMFQTRPLSLNPPNLESLFSPVNRAKRVR